MENRISYADKRVKQIIQDCFPNYRGRKVRLTNHIPTNLNSWWDGGSRTYYAFYQPSSRKVFQVHSNHPFFEANQPRDLNQESIPDDVLLISHHIFCGKDCGIEIHIKPNQTNLLE
jgi:hypothetical protein